MARLTQEDARNLKEAHSKQKLIRATVKDASGEEQDFVFKPLTREVLDLSSREASNSPTTALEIQMVNSLVFGDAEKLTSDIAIFSGLSQVWKDVQKPAQVVLGEL